MKPLFSYEITKEQVQKYFPKEYEAGPNERAIIEVTAETKGKKTVYGIRFNFWRLQPDLATGFQGKSVILFTTPSKVLKFQRPAILGKKTLETEITCALKFWLTSDEGRLSDHPFAKAARAYLAWLEATVAA